MKYCSVEHSTFPDVEFQVVGGILYHRPSAGEEPHPANRIGPPPPPRHHDRKNVPLIGSLLGRLSSRSRRLR